MLYSSQRRSPPEDVVLLPSEVRIEISKKSSGPGGQSVNAAHQAVRATHLPSGLSVHVTSSQSQMENKQRAAEGEREIGLAAMSMLIL